MKFDYSNAKVLIKKVPNLNGLFNELKPVYMVRNYYLTSLETSSEFSCFVSFFQRWTYSLNYI